jgi:inosine-uridine nucleoside N-ribohydrolase
MNTYSTNCKKAWSIAIAILLFSHGNSSIADSNIPTPQRIIFDTDIGNDVDDVLALGMIHALQSRRECELLAVTITKDHAKASAFTDAVNTFYGRGEIPIGICNSGVTPELGSFNSLVDAAINGDPIYPHDVVKKDAVKLLRELLSDAEDQSIAIVQVGFSTNLANLLRSPADEISESSGVDLIREKVSLLSMMAGAFQKINDAAGNPRDHREYNIVKDLNSAKFLASHWPTPVIWSGFEIGIALPYPHESIEKDFNYTAHHPLKDAYYAYNPPPHDRPTWDLTSVLYAVRPERGYFALSPAGVVTVDESGLTKFNATPDGQLRYLQLSSKQQIQVIETMVGLASQPPSTTF